MPIVAADADAEADASWCHLGEVRELARHWNGMTQGQQVNAQVDAQFRMQVRQRGCGHHAVIAVTDPEADVIGEEHVVDAGVGDEFDHLAALRPGPRPQLDVRSHTDTNRRHRAVH